jgi:hypothetical protein
MDTGQTRIISMHNKNLPMCPVCGFDSLYEAPYNEHGRPSFEICPCCGTEFGYHDATTEHSELRKRWIEKGMVWKYKTPPDNWNPIEQLKRAGMED